MWRCRLRFSPAIFNLKKDDIMSKANKEKLPAEVEAMTVSRYEPSAAENPNEVKVTFYADETPAISIEMPVSKFVEITQFAPDMVVALLGVASDFTAWMPSEEFNRCYAPDKRPEDSKSAETEVDLLAGYPDRIKDLASEAASKAGNGWHRGLPLGCYNVAVLSLADGLTLTRKA